MTSAATESSIHVSIVTGCAAVVPYSQSVGCSTNPRPLTPGKFLLHSRENVLPLKRPAGFEELTSKIKPPLKKKKPAANNEGPMWKPARKIAFLRGNGRAVGDNQVPTDLVLYSCPWKLKKKLEKSDLGGLSRLLLPKSDVKKHILPLMSNKWVAKIGSDSGMGVTMWDRDTESEHPVVLKYWWSSGCFVLNGHWIDMFVARRRLMVGDEIGLFWSHYDQKFYFTVLERGREGAKQH